MDIYLRVRELSCGQTNTQRERDTHRHTQVITIPVPPLYRGAQVTTTTAAAASAAASVLLAVSQGNEDVDGGEISTEWNKAVTEEQSEQYTRYQQVIRKEASPASLCKANTASSRQRTVMKLDCSMSPN